MAKKTNIYGEALSDRMKPFATDIMHMVNTLNSDKLNEREQREQRGAIQEYIKKHTNYHLADQSICAYNKASKLNPPIDLTTKIWADQKRFDKKRKFVREHQVPIAALYNMCKAARSEAEVLHILVNVVSIVWITREEDDKLNELKYRCKRPPTAYKEAGIEIWCEQTA